MEGDGEMKIVIDIPEAIYDQICKEKLDGIMARAIRCGRPLPKGHGRLIDGDELASGCDEPYWCRWLSEIEDAPTIVPAEMEVEDTPTAKVNTPTDCVSRQAAIDAVRKSYDEILDFSSNGHTIADSVEDIINTVPSAQTEPLTDKEQRIFLAAMGREEKVCKHVDEECRDYCEPYEDSLVSVCREITRKVKGVLWT